MTYSPILTRVMSVTDEQTVIIITTLVAIAAVVVTTDGRSC